MIFDENDSYLKYSQTVNSTSQGQHPQMYYCLNYTERKYHQSCYKKLHTYINETRINCVENFES